MVNQSKTIKQLSGVGIVPSWIKRANKPHMPAKRFGLVESHVIGKIADVLFRSRFAGRDWFF